KMDKVFACHRACAAKGVPHEGAPIEVHTRRTAPEKIARKAALVFEGDVFRDEVPAVVGVELEHIVARSRPSSVDRNSGGCALIIDVEPSALSLQVQANRVGNIEGVIRNQVIATRKEDRA